MVNIDYKEILDQIADGVYFLNREQEITYWNSGAERISGFRAMDALGRKCSDNLLMHTNDQGECICKTSCPTRATILDSIPREAEVFLHHKDGHLVPVWVRATPLRDSMGTIVGAIEVFSDNSAKITLEQEKADLQRFAFYDRLTDIPNRTYFEKAMQDNLDALKRYHWLFGLLYIDIDHFKKINDNHGHDVGDMVLKMVARTLSNGIRTSDKVSRWGGEEFLAIVNNCDRAKLYQTGERLRVLIEQCQMMISDQPLRVTISLGATLALESDTIESLVKRSDELMYQSKQANRNRVTVG